MSPRLQANFWAEENFASEICFTTNAHMVEPFLENLVLRQLWYMIKLQEYNTTRNYPSIDWSCSTFFVGFISLHKQWWLVREQTFQRYSLSFTFSKLQCLFHHKLWLIWNKHSRDTQVVQVSVYWGCNHANNIKSNWMKKDLFDVVVIGNHENRINSKTVRQ